MDSIVKVASAAMLLPHGFFQIDAQRILSILTKRRAPEKAIAFVQPNRLDLINPRFESEQIHALFLRVLSQMIQHRFSETQPAILRPHIHSFYFTVLRGKDFYAAAPGRLVMVKRDEESHIFAQELVDTESVTTLRRIWVAKQIDIEFGKQLQCFRRVRSLLSNRNRIHARIIPGLRDELSMIGRGRETRVFYAKQEHVR